MSDEPEPNPKDLANFGRLESWLARGAEPNPAGFKWLRDAGFATVVNLRAEDNTEKILADALGLGEAYFPVPDNAAPSDEHIVQWLALCADVNRRPLFVHCCEGHGRTSTLCVASAWRPAGNSTTRSRWPSTLQT